jgi:hypothetical protein
MRDNDYHFVGRCRVAGNVEEVADIIDDLSLPVWWPGEALARIPPPPGPSLPYLVFRLTR